MVLKPEDIDRVYREVYGEPPDDGQMIRGKETDAFEEQPVLTPFAGPTF